MEIEWEEVHLVVLLVTAVVILYSDHKAFQYFRGTLSLMSETSTRMMHRLIWGGLIGMIVTGILLALPRYEFLLADPVFYLKMAFVGILIFNGWVIGKVSHVATERPFSALTPEEKRFLLTSGTISFVSWVGAALIGYFFL